MGHSSVVDGSSIGCEGSCVGKDATSIPVAERLSQSDVPVVFLSGYTEFTVEIPDGLSNAQRLAKPFRSAELVEQVERVLGGS